MNTLPAVGLVEACDDQRLLNFPLWPRQRELLEAVERGPRLHIWACGRRSGKTTLAALVALWSCLLRPELLERLRPGERGHAVGVATSIAQARIFVRSALSVIERSPLLSSLIDGVTEDEIRFTNSTSLLAVPCTSRSTRGSAIFALLADELAHFTSESEGATTADRVWSALLPSTLQFGDDARVIAASTPYGAGEDSLFARLFQQASSGELEDALAQHAPTAAVNPTVDAAFLAREERRDPVSFRAEYGAEFLGSGQGFFDGENIAASVTLPGELRPEDAVGWVAGLDPGFSSDPFGLALVGRDPTERRRLLVGLVRSWPPPRRKASSLEEGREIEDTVLAEVAQVLRIFNARAVTDQFKSAGVVERLQRHGISVRGEPMTAPTKDGAYAFLRGRLNEGSIELYEHAALLRELRAVRTRYAAGRSSVVLPRIGGSHCDHAQALAIAVYELDRFGLGWNTSPRKQRGSPMIANLATLDRVVSSERRDPTRTPEWFERGGLFPREW